MTYRHICMCSRAACCTPKPLRSLSGSGFCGLQEEARLRWLIPDGNVIMTWKRDELYDAILVYGSVPVASHMIDTRGGLAYLMDCEFDPEIIGAVIRRRLWDFIAHFGSDCSGPSRYKQERQECLMVKLKEIIDTVKKWPETASCIRFDAKVESLLETPQLFKFMVALYPDDRKNLVQEASQLIKRSKDLDYLRITLARLEMGPRRLVQLPLGEHISEEVLSFVYG